MSGYFMDGKRTFFDGVEVRRKCPRLDVNPRYTHFLDMNGNLRRYDWLYRVTDPDILPKPKLAEIKLLQRRQEAKWREDYEKERAAEMEGFGDEQS